MLLLVREGGRAGLLLPCTSLPHAPACPPPRARVPTRSPPPSPAARAALSLATQSSVSCSKRRSAAPTSAHLCLAAGRGAAAAAARLGRRVHLLPRPHPVTPTSALVWPAGMFIAWTSSPVLHPCPGTSVCPQASGGWLVGASTGSSFACSRGRGAGRGCGACSRAQSWLAPAATEQGTPCQAAPSRCCNASCRLLPQDQRQHGPAAGPPRLGLFRPVLERPHVRLSGRPSAPL